MAQDTGTFGLDDLLAARFSSAATFGLDTINKQLQINLDDFNAQVADQLNWLADPLFVQSRVYGTSASIELIEVDEFGAAPTRKNLPGETVSFPLRGYQNAIGWTRKFLNIATPAEVASAFIQAQDGYAQRLILEIRKSIYNDTNFTFIDKLTNGVSLSVKRFINADSQAIPDSPAGAGFDASTHDHYISTSSGTLANGDVDSMVSTVTEHGNTKGVKIVVDLSDKTAFVALTGFVALGDAGIIYNAADTTLVKKNFDNVENQLLGYWRDSSVEVWVKPWAVGDYLLCIATDGIEKAIGYRQRSQPSLQGFILVPRVPGFPVMADYMEAEFGFGVWNRTAGAVMISNSNTYSNPTLS